MFSHEAVKGIAIFTLCALFGAKGVFAHSQFEGNILEYQDVIGIEFLEDPKGVLDINDVNELSILNKFERFSGSSFNFGLKQTTL